jgi:hypothetical protein
MSTTTIRATVFCGLASLVLLVQTAPAGAISGAVRDTSKSPPGDSASGVWIQLEDGNNQRVGMRVQSDGGGQYEIPGVPDGQFTLVADALGYSPRIQRIPVTINGASRANDIWVTQNDPSRQAGLSHARTINDRLKASPNKREALSREWGYLQAINYPPASRAWLASGLAEIDGEARAILPDLNAYAECPADRVAESQDLFHRALIVGGEPPDRARLEAMGIRPEIAADVATFVVRGSAEPDPKKQAFVEHFRRQWEGTDAPGRLMEKLK